MKLRNVLWTVEGNDTLNSYGWFLWATRDTRREARKAAHGLSIRHKTRISKWTRSTRAAKEGSDGR